MKETRYTCDGCGKEIKEDPVEICFFKRIRETEELTEEGLTEEERSVGLRHFCGDCAARIAGEAAREPANAVGGGKRCGNGEKAAEGSLPEIAALKPGRPAKPKAVRTEEQSEEQPVRPQKKGARKRLGHEHDAEILKKFESGMSIAVIAREYDVTDQTIYKHVQHEEERRRQEKEDLKFTDENVIGWYKKGLSTNEIAEKLNVHPATARRHIHDLRAAGVIE